MVEFSLETLPVDVEEKVKTNFLWLKNLEIKIKYQDENFNIHEDSFDGIVARVIQHEYDHLEGVLFTDRISPFKKKLIKGKLKNIITGKVPVDYVMNFFKSQSWF